MIRHSRQGPALSEMGVLGRASARSRLPIEKHCTDSNPGETKDQKRALTEHRNICHWQRSAGAIVRGPAHWREKLALECSLLALSSPKLCPG